MTPEQQQANDAAAIAAARTSSKVVFFAWSQGTLDKPLPEGQDKLIEEIAARNPNIIVVLNTSQPVAMPWLSKVKAVLEMWYPGQEGGWATADVLLGKANPAGRLPFTWPQTLDQGVANVPSHPERSSLGVGCTICTGPQANGKTTYSEGIFIGYRWYDQQKLTPLYPFGYGLSYTKFDYSHLGVRLAKDGGLDVSFHIQNVGLRSGDEVPQVYLGMPDKRPAGVQFAVNALAGYQRITLAAGQGEDITIHVPLRQLQYWLTTANRWITATGMRSIFVGTSSRDFRLQGTIS
jgi:beta-glucosidase